MRYLLILSLLVLGCSSIGVAQLAEGSGRSGSSGGSASSPPLDDMAVIPAGTYVASDPVFAPSATGECSAETIAKVKAVVNQLPLPDRPQEVASFQIDKQRVRCADYKKCVNSGASAHDSWIDSCSDHAARATQDEAVAYCRWRTAKLPSLLQWQAAVRGKTGRVSADCDDKTSAARCTITSGEGVSINGSTASLGEFTSTVGCWSGRPVDEARAHPLKVTPH